MDLVAAMPLGQTLVHNSIGGPPVSIRSNADISNVPSDAGRTRLVLNGGTGERSHNAGWVPTIEELSGVDVEPKILRLDHGLYALSVEKVHNVTSEHSGILLPATQISQPPSNSLRSAEIIACDSDSASWFGCEGGTVVIKTPPGGGV